MNTNLIKRQSIDTLIAKHLASMTTLNDEGSLAYKLPAKQALAQLVSTGTLNNTYYVAADSQLDDILALAQKVDNAFLAKLAVYARQHGRMKDTPVLLLALLSTRADSQDLFKQVFAKVINNGKQLRNFVQVMRSGIVGRKSLGSMPKKMVNHWLNHASDYHYVSATIGTTPKLRDVLRMTHPKPTSDEREALFQWTLGKAFKVDNLPDRVQQLLAFQKDNTQPMPDVPLQLLMALPLTDDHWAQIAKQGSFTMVRMNLNTFARHGVFEIAGMIDMIIAKLTDRDAIIKSGVFPYQLYTTWASVSDAVTDDVKKALSQAMDIALTNVPKIEGNVVVAVDTSGSMSWPITGSRKGATSVVRCIDAAALFAAAIKRVNPQTRIIAFDTQIRDIPNDANSHDASSEDKDLDRFDNLNVTPLTLSGRIQSRRQQRKSEKQLKARRKAQAKANKEQTTRQAYSQIDVLKLAEALAALGGGGTNVSLPLTHLNAKRAAVDVMIYFSDNQSWVDDRYDGTTQMMLEWNALKQRCPNAKLICVDVQPYQHSQAHERDDVLNIGGFGDEVFRLIDLYCQGQLTAGHWVDEVERTSLETTH